MVGNTSHPKRNAIDERILILRGERVLIDDDLAHLYGVTTKRLNEQVKRNRARFPADFLFRLDDQDLANLRSQIATSSLASGKWGGRRHAPYAFTEHGALMAANVLNSSRALRVSVYVVRAFVRLRRTLAEHAELARKLDALEKKTESLSDKHDALAADTRDQLRHIIDVLRQLMSAPEPQRRPIGFVTPTKTTR